MIPTVDEIITSAARIFAVTRQSILSRRREPHFCRPRFAVCIIARDMGLSLPVIGRSLDGRHHTTILAACRRAEHWMEQDAQYRYAVDAVRADVAIGKLQFVRHGGVVRMSGRGVLI